MGLPLHRIKDIRLLYKANAYDNSVLNFEK